MRSAGARGRRVIWLAVLLLALTPTACAPTTTAASTPPTLLSPAPRQRPTQHILTDRAVVQALEDAAGRGVDARVLLESHPFGEGDVQPARMREELSEAGVQARQAPTWPVGASVA